MPRIVFLILIFFNVTSLFAQGGDVFTTLTGQVNFSSDAPMELIKAQSNELKGAIQTNVRSFTFKIRIRSFEGFNNGLQKEHFNDNYLESNKYPEASFKGKIIEEVDWTKDGHYQIRTKGILNIHGVEQERIIKSDIVIKAGKINIESSFTVLLSDHNIPIPRIVKDKLAQEIKVEIKATLQQK